MGTPIHGGNAILYLSAGSGEAVPVGELTDYSIELDRDIQDATALGTSWGSSVGGPMSWSGSLSGNFDLASKVLWLAGTSINAQKFYIYPLRTASTDYYYGMAFVKLGKVIAGGSKAKATVSATLHGVGELGLKP
jgi:hypothetical protein